MSDWTSPTGTLLLMIAADRLPLPEREVRFHETRKWRFDLAWPAARVAVEIEGGSYVGGRHTTGPGFWRDLEKYNEAALAGWTVIRVTPRMITDGSAIAWLSRALQTKTGQPRDEALESPEIAHEGDER